MQLELLKTNLFIYFISDIYRVLRRWSTRHNHCGPGKGPDRKANRLCTCSSHVLTDSETTNPDFFFIVYEKIGFSVKNNSYYWHLKKNPFIIGQNKQQISWKEFRFRIFRIRENM